MLVEHMEQKQLCRNRFTVALRNLDCGHQVRDDRRPKRLADQLPGQIAEQGDRRRVRLRNPPVTIDQQRRIAAPQHQLLE